MNDSYADFSAVQSTSAFQWARNPLKIATSDDGICTVIKYVVPWSTAPSFWHSS